MAAEYYVDDFVTTDSHNALMRAFQRSVAQGRTVDIDVIIYDEEDAREFGGDIAAEQYRENPDDSVFCRYTIKAELVGRIP